MRGPAALGVAAPALRDVLRRDEAFEADRRVVREHPRAVEAFPPEAVAREASRVVPQEFGGEERADAAQPENLGQRPGVAEGVGQPQGVVRRAELAGEEPAPVEDLPDQRLAVRDVAVGLDPRGAHRLPAAFPYPLLHLRVEGRVLLLHEGVELCLRLREAERRVPLHQPQRRRERACALPPGLGERPEPHHVDVGMPHEVHPATTSGPGRPFGRESIDQGQRASDGGGVAVPPAAVEQRVEFRQEALDAVAVLPAAQHCGQVAKGGHRVQQAVRGLVENADARVPKPGAAEGSRARGLDRELDRSSAGESCRQHDVVVLTVESMVGRPVDVQQPFGHVEVQQQVLAPPGSVEVQGVVEPDRLVRPPPAVGQRQRGCRVAGSPPRAHGHGARQQAVRQRVGESMARRVGHRQKRAANGRSATVA